MSGQFSFGMLSSPGPTGQGGEGPFRILLMGDFSGRKNRGVCEPALRGRRPEMIDVDNYGQVLRDLGAGLRIRLGGQSGQSEQGGPEVALSFGRLDDFHPDRLYDELDVFRSLRGLRQRLGDASTFAAAAEEVRSWAAPAPTPAAAPAPPAPGAATPPAAGGESSDALLGRLLGQRPAKPSRPASASVAAGVDAFIRDLVGPYIVPERDRDQPALLRRVDEAVAAQMRAILHHADFQALEAAWRALEFVVANVETDEDLQLALLDLTRDELAAGLTADDDLASTAPYKVIVDQGGGTEGGRRWAVVAAAFRFDKTLADAVALGRIAKIAARAGAAFVAGACDRVVGCQSLAATPDPDDWSAAIAPDDAAAWQQLRKLPEAVHVGLALPRFLLRLPYGKDTELIERFDFAEFFDTGAGAGAGAGPGAARERHERYLWGNPAFILAQALGSAFRDHGWQMQPQLYRDVEGLPMHVFVADGDRQVKPCAEVYLTDRAGQRIQDAGVTALLSIQHRDAIRLRGVASIADPVTALAGPWNA